MTKKRRDTRKTTSVPVMTDESDFSFDEAFRFSEAQFLNEDSSDLEETSINALLYQLIEASLLKDIEDDVLEFSDDSFFGSIDEEEEELWEKIKELTLNETRSTSLIASERSVSTDTIKVNKKSGNKSFEENATNKKNSGKKSLKQLRKSKAELVDELNRHKPTSSVSLQSEIQANRNLRKDRNKKKTARETINLPENRIIWREPDSIIVSDFEDNVIDLYSDEETSNSSPSSKHQGKSTKDTKSSSTKTQLSTPKSKSQIRKEKREEKKEKRKEKRERIKKLKSESVNIHNINRLMRDFVKEPRLASIPLQCMDRGKRRAVHLLAKEYNLVSKSKGAGDRKYPVLYRTQRTSIPVNPNGIFQILESSHSIPRKTKSPYDLIKAEKRDKARSKDKKNTTPSKASRAYNPNSPVPPVGSIVGQHAKPIGESNIGHQMLQKMGWSPGQSLASSSSPGRTAPVEAIVRGKSRIGLGGAL